MRFGKIQQIRLHEQIIKRFYEMAGAGELQAGDRLPPERELLKQLGVSRQVLREALTVMEAQGSITTTPGGGRVFAGKVGGDVAALLETLRESALLEILIAREAIECKTAELAAEHATGQDIADLRARLAAIGPTNYSYVWNSEFHLAIAECGKNGLLHNLLSVLLDARRDVLEHDYLTREQLERLFSDHEGLVDAIEARDPERAREAMRAHLRLTRDEFDQRRSVRAGERQMPADDVVAAKVPKLDQAVRTRTSNPK